MAIITITIRSGNDAMLDGIDASRAVSEVAEQIEWYALGAIESNVGITRPVIDDNGGTVGSWSITE